MKNYLTVWQRWAAAKATIVTQHARITASAKTIIAEIKDVCGQDIPAVSMDIEGVPLKFYPFWDGFAYTYKSSWSERPEPSVHWGWTLAETEATARWMETVNEEELRLLFRQWSEKSS